MIIKNRSDTFDGHQIKITVDYDYPSGLDRYCTAILDFLIENAFYFNPSDVDKDLQGWMTLTSYSSIARAINCNPRTVQSKIKKLVEAEHLEVVDIYPKDHRTLVSIYRVFYIKPSK